MESFLLISLSLSFLLWKMEITVFTFVMWGGGVKDTMRMTCLMSSSRGSRSIITILMIIWLFNGCRFYRIFKDAWRIFKDTVRSSPDLCSLCSRPPSPNLESICLRSNFALYLDVALLLVRFAICWHRCPLFQGLGPTSCLFYGIVDGSQGQRVGLIVFPGEQPITASGPY